MGDKLNSIHKKYTKTTNTTKPPCPLNVGTWFSFILAAYVHKLPSFVCRGALWLGEVGDAEGTMPSGEYSPPREG